VQEEEREKGKVGFWVYWKYLTLAYKGVLVPLVLLAQILFQVLQIGSNYWMAWAAPVSKDVEPPVSMSTLISVYIALAVGSSFCVLLRALFLVTASYKTATLLFNKMHMSIFRAPMSFFDSTPSGRILNRVSNLHVTNFLGSTFFSTMLTHGHMDMDSKLFRLQLIKAKWTPASLTKWALLHLLSYNLLELLL